MSVFDTDNAVSSDLPTQKETTAKPFSVWNKLRREAPRDYYKPKTQERMMKDASILKDAFFDQREREWYDQ